MALYESLLDLSTQMPSLSDISSIPSKLSGKPASIVKAFMRDVTYTRLSNFRLRLLMHCAALNQDTAIFHMPGSIALVTLYVHFISLLLKMLLILFIVALLYLMLELRGFLA